MPGLGPAADLLSCIDKKEGKETTPTGRSGLWPDCSAVLGHEGPHRTHFAAFGRCVQTCGASQFTKRAGARAPQALRSSTPLHGVDHASRASLTHRPSSVWRQREARRRWDACAAGDVLLLGPLRSRRAAQGLGAACTARFVNTLRVD